MNSSWLFWIAGLQTLLMSARMYANLRHNVYLQLTVRLRTGGWLLHQWFNLVFRGGKPGYLCGSGTASSRLSSLRMLDLVLSSMSPFLSSRERVLDFMEVYGVHSTEERWHGKSTECYLSRGWFLSIAYGTAFKLVLVETAWRLCFVRCGPVLITSVSLLMTCLQAFVVIDSAIANHLPESSGTTTRDFMCFFLFWLISLPAIWFPIHQMYGNSMPHPINIRLFKWP